MCVTHVQDWSRTVGVLAGERRAGGRDADATRKSRESPAERRVVVVTNRRVFVGSIVVKTCARALRTARLTARLRAGGPPPHNTR